MDFRELLHTLETLEKPVLSEAITLSAIVALTSGYENDDKVRIPKLAELARENNLEGLVDPVTGNYVSNEGDEDDEVPFEIAEKLSAAGLLPSNARLPQAGWFDNNRVYDAANSNLRQQSSAVSAHHEMIADKMRIIRELVKNIVALRDKHATNKMQSEIGEKPILPSNAPSPLAAKITPTFPSQTMAGFYESAGLANAIMDSMMLFEDLKDQEWSFKRPEAAPTVAPAPSEVTYLKHPELTQSKNAALKTQPPTTASLAGGEYNTANLKPTAEPAAEPAAEPVSDKAAKKAAKKAASKTAGMDMDALAKAASTGGKAAAPGVLRNTIGRLAPGLATAYSAADAYDRYKKGDYTGAGIAGAAGLASLVPGIGTGVGIGLDAYNAYRDYTAPGGEVNPNKQKEVPAEPTDDTPTEPTSKPVDAPAAPPTAKQAINQMLATPKTGGTTKPVTKTQPQTPPHKVARAISTQEFQQYLRSLGAQGTDITSEVDKFILGNNQ